MDATIILSDGKEVSLKVWQRIYKLPEGSLQIANHFSIGERSIVNGCKVSSVLLKLLDRVRDRWGKPLSLNSLDRTIAKQQELKDSGFIAASESTHTKCLAADIDTTSNEESDKLVKIIEEVAKEMGIKVRIGWQDYKKLKQTFVHVDVGPEYYGIGKPYRLMKFPAPWAIEARW